MLPANAMATKDEGLLTRKVHLGCGRDGVADLVAHRCELASRLGALQKTSRKRRVSEGKRSSRGKECGGRQSLTHCVKSYMGTSGEGGSVERQQQDLGVETSGRVCVRGPPSTQEM